ncbi:unnamed protein product, partial [Laminaria digitata]
GECVSLKNFVIIAEITGNLIRDCGVIDLFFDNGEDGKNGDGIYIGTSSDKVRGRTNAPDFGEDRCNNNLISGNNISTNGNECVEAKEGSSGKVFENNVCSNQLDSESGCFVSRGDANTIRY